ncbi:AMP-binding protein [Hyphomicrobium sp. CS1BSMeth3]|uniref:AMP-binding protein n=1 Tax=Hyphomicrobium sp. CS1BSMeth3 TaxID=1892844 RepID=UPI0009316BC4|nr:AMP-binding protein [Hyphomicrobium sp. CS1BSMeth3]
MKLSYPNFSPRFAEADWTVPRLLERQAARIPERPFLQWTDDEAPLSFAEVNRRANRLAHGLSRAGVAKGDRVVLLLPNSLEYVLLWFAANKIGAVEVAINPSYRDRFLRHQLETSGGNTIVVTHDMLEEIEADLGEYQTLKRLIVIGAPGARSKRSLQQGAEVFAFEQIEVDDERNPECEILPQDTAAILFTSGTTGPSKGVLMTHAQLYLFGELSAQLVRMTEDDVYLTSFPFYHANAQFLTIYPSLIYGIRCVLYEKFSAGQWLQRLINTGATIVNSVGVTLPFVMAQPPSPRDKAHRLRCIFAAPTPHDMLAAFRERFGEIEIVEGYGQTEICLPLLSPYGIKRPKGACGVAVQQWFDLQIVDPATDAPVANGEVGELVVRARTPWTLNQGYVSMPERSLEAFRNFWFHTGDGFRKDDSGWFYFSDRIKDAIRRRGENISSFEIEEPIREHPAVEDVAIVGVPSDFEGGEDEVKACIVLRPGSSFSPQAFVEWCRSHLPRFAVPRYVQLYSDFPRTPSQRVQKHLLRRRTDRTDEWDAQTQAFGHSRTSATNTASASANASSSRDEFGTSSAASLLSVGPASASRKPPC